MVALYEFDERLGHSIFIELDRLACLPNIVRKRIAEPCGLTGPQLESWLKFLNILRNYAAHHARMFSRVYDIKPKLNNDPKLTPVANRMNRVFGQLSMIQYYRLHDILDEFSAIGF